MANYSLALDYYQNHLTATQTADDIVKAFGITHKTFRNLCVDNDIHVPHPTLGLALEVRAYYNLAFEKSAAQICREYHITLHEFHYCLEQNDEIDAIEIEQTVVKDARDAGVTEAEILERWGKRFINRERMVEEINQRIQAGEKQVDLATIYQITPARVSQINKKSRGNTRLTIAQRLEIADRRTESSHSIAKEFGISLDRVYKIRREFS